MKRTLLSRLFIFVIVVVFISCKRSDKVNLKSEFRDKMAYMEQHRPQFHFSPKSNWMNDPNGMFYYDGKYHLFYQYFPDSTVWGPMHWGHAESIDLVNWTHLPIALFPDSLGCIFSGGAVVDNKNTSGLGKNGIPPIIATFTHHNFEGEKAKSNDFQFQSLAFSQDGGYTWSKYAQNPIIPNTEKIKDFRDPKVVWYEELNQWIMVLAAYDKVKFYSSSNLLDWKHVSDFGIDGDNRLWECPDLFPLKAKGTNETKWVLMVSIQKDAPNGGTASSYFIGDFDGESFKSNPMNQKWLDYGTDNYAFVTWNNINKTDEEVFGIGWMSNWQYAQEVPTHEWRSAMTLPRKLTLIKNQENYTLNSQPVSTLLKLCNDSKTILKNESFSGHKQIDEINFRSQAELSLSVDLKKTEASIFEIKISNQNEEHFTVSFERNTQQMKVDRTSSNHKKFNKIFYEKIHSAPLNFDSDNLNIQIYFDVSSAEIFINDGEISFSSIYFPSLVFDKITANAIDGNCYVNELKICSLNGIWTED